MEHVMNEGSSMLNYFGKQLLNVIRKNKGGEFPTNVTEGEIKTALSEMQRDTSPATVRLAAKALEREGVRTPVFAGTVESHVRKADLLITGAVAGASIQESMSLVPFDLGEAKPKKGVNPFAKKDDEDKENGDDEEANGNGDKKKAKKKESFERPFTEAASGRRIVQEFDSKVEGMNSEVLSMMAALDNAPGADDLDPGYWEVLKYNFNEVHRKLNYVSTTLKFPEYNDVPR